MKDQQKEFLRYIHLSDYKKFDYSIPEIYINFIIEDENVKVISDYKFIKENPNSNYLKLKGFQLILKTFHLNNSMWLKKKEALEWMQMIKQLMDLQNL